MHKNMNKVNDVALSAMVVGVFVSVLVAYASIRATRILVKFNNENMEEAVAALVALGFQKAASVKVVEKLMKEDASMAVGKIVKRALSMM